ncbi:hypothetical protein MPER_11265 [Moniliophthora perniciosa FA553]|nr:hypothetical protein MPER_11265 [Moniliophthora perniciosa FA553]
MSSDYRHGVVYSPSSLQPHGRISPEELKARGITYVRLQWLDLVNTLRERIIPISSFLKMLGTSRPGITMVAAWAGLIYLNLAEGFGAVGENFYAVDLSTLILCPYEKDHACVMGWFQEKTPVQGILASEICPRMALKRVVEIRPWRFSITEITRYNQRCDKTGQRLSSGRLNGIIFQSQTLICQSSEVQVGRSERQGRTLG